MRYYHGFYYIQSLGAPKVHCRNVPIVFMLRASNRYCEHSMVPLEFYCLKLLYWRTASE